MILDQNPNHHGSAEDYRKNDPTPLTGVRGPVDNKSQGWCDALEMDGPVFVVWFDSLYAQTAT